MNCVKHITLIGKLNLKNFDVKTKRCNYSDACIAVKGTIAVTNIGTAAAPNNENKEVVFKHFVAFTDYISELKYEQV